MEVVNAKVLDIDGNITREWMKERGFDIKQWDTIAYDLADNSKPGDYIYDALYNAVDNYEPEYEPDEDMDWGMQYDD